MWLELTEKQWRPFKIGDNFHVSKGTYLSKKQILKGLNPYVTASASNNGLTDFIGNKTLFPSNMITIEKVKLSAFYQPVGFYCSHDVSVVSHQKLNKLSGLFISSMINRQGQKYSYGRQAQLNVVKRETAFMPIDLEGEPDWQFMQDYTKALMDKKKAKYIEFCRKELAKLKLKNIVKLEDKEWHEFFLKDIFKIVQRGKRLTKANQIEGHNPYVSSTSLNNGINDFIGNEDSVRIFSNCLTVANSGSVGASFYQPYKFVASDHVTHLQNDQFDRFTYLFIATLTNRLSDKYNFNREINDKRISRDKVMLPVNEDHRPDFEYMGQYMMNQEYLKRKQYLNYNQSEK